MESPPPLPAARPDWWTRNWKWFVPVACFAGLLVLGGFVFCLLALLRSSDAYVGAVARVKAAPAVMDAVGSPAKEGFFFTGQVRLNGRSGKANLTIPIEGPKGRATIYAVARKVEGVWHYDRLIVQLDQGGRRVDLSER